MMKIAILGGDRKVMCMGFKSVVSIRAFRTDAACFILRSVNRQSLYNLNVINQNKRNSFSVEVLAASAGLRSVFLCHQAGFGKKPAGVFSAGCFHFASNSQLYSSSAVVMSVVLT